MLQDTRPPIHSQSAAAAQRAALLASPDRPHQNLGAPPSAAGIPQELAGCSRWLSWCWIRTRDGMRWTKLPQGFDRAAERFKPGFSWASDQDRAGLQKLNDLLPAIKKADPDSSSLGLMISLGPVDEDRPDGAAFVAIDLDGIDPNDQAGWPDLLVRQFKAGRGFWCSSPSGCGIRIVGIVAPMAGHRGGTIRAPFIAELKTGGCPTVTNAALHDSRAGLHIDDLWRSLQELLPARPVAFVDEDYQPSDLDSNAEFMARLLKAAESYFSKAEAAAGSFGHNAFFRICCRIAGGFGLRDNVGFALASQINESRCSPPFEPDDLAHKWNDALRVTAGEQHRLRAPVEESWRNRKAARPSSRLAKKTQATDRTDDRARDGRLICIPDRDNCDNTRAAVCRILAGATGERVYQRLGRAVLVLWRDARICWTDPATGKKILRGPESRACIAAAESGNLLPIVSRQVAFRKVRVEKGGAKYLEVAPVPQTLLMMLKAAPNELPPLRGLLFGPSYDSECDRVLAEPGYHPSVGLELVTPVAGLNIPQHVTQPRAAAAARRILDCYRFFPWPEAADGQCIQRARLLVAMMTALLRWSFGPAPAVLLRGKSAGSGKTDICKSISEIVHGSQPRLMAWATGRYAEDELRKRLAMLLASGESFVLVDNVTTGSEIDSATLNALLTCEGDFTDRQLGSNSAGADVGGANHLCVFFTGNSVSPADDMSERILVVDFTAPEGNRRGVDPSEFGDIGELLPYVRHHRKELLECLIIIARGYQQAGRPQTSQTHWGSFGAWRDACVQPIAWALELDPLTGLHAEWKERSVAGDGLAQLAIIWLDEYPGRRFTTRELLKISTPIRDDENRPATLAYCEPLAEALESVCNLDFISKASPVDIGRRLTAFAGRPKTRTAARVAGTFIELPETGERWCLMTEKDRRKNNSVFWLEAFNGPPESRLVPDAEMRRCVAVDRAGFEGKESKTPYINSASSIPPATVNALSLESGTPSSKPSPHLRISAAPLGSSGESETGETEPELVKLTHGQYQARLEGFTQGPVAFDRLRLAWIEAGLPGAWLEKNLYGTCDIVDGNLQSKAAIAKTKGKAKRGRS